MKRVLVIIAILIVVVLSKEEKGIIIPTNAIRFRVIANSNTIEDQTIKNNVALHIEKYIIGLTSSAKSSDEAKKILLNNKENIENEVENYMVMNNINMKYDLKIGKNYFPKKIYHGVEYDPGNYESVVLSLGNKQGLNWWCVMYPPLCLIDRSTATSSDTEFTTLAQELLNKYN